MSNPESIREKRKSVTTNRNQMMLLETLSQMSPYRRIVFLEAMQDLTLMVKSPSTRIHINMVDLEIVAKVLCTEDESGDLTRRFQHLFLN